MLLWIAILTYLISGAGAIWFMLNNKPINQVLVYGAAIIGVLAHTASLASSLFVSEMLQMSLLNSISVCVWMTISVIVISSVTKPLHNLFTFFMPAGALFLIIAHLAPQMASPKLYTAGMMAHIMISLLAYSIMIIVTLQALLVNIQTNHLHKHQFNSPITSILPPLQSMERLMFEWLMIGFILLTAAIVTGTLYVDNLLAQHLIHKTVLTLVSWIFYATLIFGHFYLGWRGQRASRLIYLGFGFLLVAFVGSKFVLEYLLQVE
ncbi:MAG: cytochrome c biogenesis protein CcsA [Reinekea sp.]|jgi:ABC-type uncharacterized transport system permease subunit